MELDNNKPVFVESHDVTLDAEYAEWIAEVKHRYRSAQVKAAVKVNAEKLLWNWQMGRDLVQKKAEERWGAGIVEQVSIDLRREFPNENGFSTSNLWYMKKWYLFYAGEEQKLQRLIGELQNSVNQEYEKIQCSVGEIPKQSVSEIGSVAFIQFPLPFALIPWGQHIEIITRSKSFVDHRDVLHGELDWQESYPVTSKFIAYSDEPLKTDSLLVYYSIDNGPYQVAHMTATGNPDEYVGYITGCHGGSQVDYYVFGADESGHRYTQPVFAALEPHHFTVGPHDDFVGLIGDADVNGHVDINDVLAIMRHALQITSLSSEGMQLADVNGDGSVNINDAVALLRIVLGIV